jgi:hypothetical protein
LPSGVSLDSSTGALSGVPLSEGSATFMVRAADGAGRSAFRRLTLSVGPVFGGGSALGGSTGRECSAASAGAPGPGGAFAGALLAAALAVLSGRRGKGRGVGR